MQVQLALRQRSLTAQHACTIDDTDGQVSGDRMDCACHVILQVLGSCCNSI